MILQWECCLFWSKDVGEFEDTLTGSPLDPPSLASMGVFFHVPAPLVIPP